MASAYRERQRELTMREFVAAYRPPQSAAPRVSSAAKEAKRREWAAEDAAQAAAADEALYREWRARYGAIPRFSGRFR